MEDAYELIAAANVAEMEVGRWLLKQELVAVEISGRHKLYAVAGIDIRVGWDMQTNTGNVFRYGKVEGCAVSFPRQTAQGERASTSFPEELLTKMGVI